MKEKKIGLVGAMEPEIIHLRDKIENMKSFTRGGIEFYQGMLEGVEVCIVRSGIGKVNAAIATTLLLDEFGPDVVINTGCAGGTATDANVGDVVISTSVTHHDVNLTVFGYKVGQVPGAPEAFEADSDLVERATKVMDECHLRSHKGLIASGDTFMCEPDHIEKVKSDFPGVLALEMEAAGVAQTCQKFGVPFVVTRALSDIAGKESVNYDEFLETAAKNSTEFILHMLRS